MTKSDLDLLVEMPENISILALGGFLMDVRALFGVWVEVTGEKMLKPSVRDRILLEAIPI